MVSCFEGIPALVFREPSSHEQLIMGRARRKTSGNMVVFLTLKRFLTSPDNWQPYFVGDSMLLGPECRTAGKPARRVPRGHSGGGFPKANGFSQTQDYLKTVRMSSCIVYCISV